MKDKRRKSNTRNTKAKTQNIEDKIQKTSQNTKHRRQNSKEESQKLVTQNSKHSIKKCLKPRSCAQFAPGYKFAPGVNFWPCERCFKNLHPVQICSYFRCGVNLFAPGCKLCTWTQTVKFIYILIGDFDKWQLFSFTLLFKID